MTTPLTFAEFEQRAGELLGRRPFGAASRRRMFECATILRDAADEARCLIAHVETGASPQGEVAALLAIALGRVLMQTAALANELGQPLEVIAGAGLMPLRTDWDLTLPEVTP